MGLSGTDVAREAADLVLLDDDFATVVAAVEQGRATFSNVHRFLTYHLTDNVAELTPFVVWALSGGRFPLALGVLQILCLDIGTDLLPALALGAEAPNTRALARPPMGRHLIDAPLLRRVFCVLGPAEAVMEMTAFVVALMAAGWRPGDTFPTGHALAAASGAAFAAVVIGQMANAFACRSATRWPGALGWTGNRLLVGAVAAELGFLGAFLLIHPVASILDHAAPPLAGLGVAVLAAPAVLLADALHKRARASAGRGILGTMKAWVVRQPGPIDGDPLAFVERPAPEPRERELRVRVTCCGVCRTDLHLAEGDLAPHGRDIVPGHEVVGIVDELGELASRFSLGDRVGNPVAAADVWRLPLLPAGRREPVHRTALHRLGRRRRVRRVRRRRRAVRVRASPGVLRRGGGAAPVRGIIGFRALRRAALPPGGRLGIYGFGGSAHLAAQVAMAEGATVHVMTAIARRAGAGARPRRRVGGRHARRAAGAARLGDHLRSRRRDRPDRARRARPRRHARHRGHPPQRHPAAAVRRPPVSGAAAPQRHRQHPPRRRRVPRHRGSHPGSGRGHAVPARARRCGPARSRPRPGERRRGASRRRLTRASWLKASRKWAFRTYQPRSVVARMDAVTSRTTGGPMNVTEFFAYLLGSDARPTTSGFSSTPCTPSGPVSTTRTKCSSTLEPMRKLGRRPERTLVPGAPFPVLGEFGVRTGVAERTGEGVDSCGSSCSAGRAPGREPSARGSRSVSVWCTSRPEMPSERRWLRNRGSVDGSAAFVAAGELVPDDLAVSVVAEALTRTGCGRRASFSTGSLAPCGRLSGSTPSWRPRTSTWSSISASTTDVVLRRLLNRRVCIGCGHIAAAVPSSARSRVVRRVRRHLHAPRRRHRAPHPPASRALRGADPARSQLVCIPRHAAHRRRPRTRRRAHRSKSRGRRTSRPRYAPSEAPTTVLDLERAVDAGSLG